MKIFENLRLVLIISIIAQKLKFITFSARMYKLKFFLLSKI